MNDNLDFNNVIAEAVSKAVQPLQHQIESIASKMQGQNTNETK